MVQDTPSFPLIETRSLRREHRASRLSRLPHLTASDSVFVQWKDSGNEKEGEEGWVILACADAHLMPLNFEATNY